MTSHSRRLYALGVLLCLGAASCTSSEAGSSEAAPAEEAAARHCFRNEYPFPDDPQRADVLELSLVVDGDLVTGTYSWLPAFKDQRVGTLQGRVHDGAIVATYSFSQEGVTQAVEVTIALEVTRALVQGGSPELGLDGDVERVACSG